MLRAIKAGRLLTPSEQIPKAVVLIDNGVVMASGPAYKTPVPAGARVTDFPNGVLAPGFVDIHIHGADGHDAMEPTPDALVAIERFLAGHGVTSYCPTTITAPLTLTLSVLGKLADWIESRSTQDEPRAFPVGIHMEGPFLSPAKRGVQPEEYLLEGSIETFQRLWEAARGHIVNMTIAPEVPGAMDVIREASRLGVCMSFGHTNADSNVAQQAISAGARHATHTFNGMRALDHREPGVLGSILTNEHLTAEIIADGVHVHPEIVKLFVRAKGNERTVLVTDAISATGKRDGHYRLGTFEVEVKGSICRSADGRLAGSVLTLDQAVRNVMRFTRCNLKKAVRFATLNPCGVIKARHKGTLRPGADADMVVLSPDGQVIHTIIAGQDFAPDAGTTMRGVRETHSTQSS